MTKEEFRNFLKTLEPMKGHGDKTAINQNYRKLLDAGFRCNRKEHCYQDKDGNKTTWKFIPENGIMVWIKL